MKGITVGKWLKRLHMQESGNQNGEAIEVSKYYLWKSQWFNLNSYTGSHLNLEWLTSIQLALMSKST